MELPGLRQTAVLKLAQKEAGTHRTQMKRSPSPETVPLLWQRPSPCSPTPTRSASEGVQQAPLIFVEFSSNSHSTLICV